MATFIQDVGQELPSSIGNQQVTSPKDSSRAIGAIADSVVRGIDTVGNAVADETGKSIVAQAQQQVDQELKESEELARLDSLENPTVAQVEKQTKLLSKGVARGQISRENARLRVSDLVTKAIEEQPFFADKIRQSASNLLGFNPESEGVRQFFSSFETEASINREKSSRLTYTDKMMERAEFLAANGVGTVGSNMRMLAQQEALDAQKAVATNLLDLNNLSAEQWFTRTQARDTVQANMNIIGAVKGLADQGETIDKNVWRNTINAHRDAAWNSTLSLLSSKEKLPDTTTLSRMKKLHDDRYEQLYTTVEGYDSNFLSQQNIERLQTAQEAYSYEAFPVYKFMVDEFGERTTNKFLDMIASANGDQKMLDQIFEATPGFSGLQSLLKEDPSKFSAKIRGTLEKLSDPNAELSDSDTEMVNLIVSQAVTAPPEERESVIEKLQSKNLSMKAASVLAKLRPNSATALEKKVMKESWAVAKNTIPQRIGALIQNQNLGSLTQRDARLEVNSDGTLSLVKTARANLHSPLTDLQLTDHPAWDEIQKINLFIKASDNGWGTELGIKSKEMVSREIIEAVNKSTPNEGGFTFEEIEAYREARKTGDTSKLPDSRYIDANGNTITVKNGKIVE